MFHLFLAVTENTREGIPEWIIGLINIIVGFILGLIGASFLDWLKTFKKKKHFCTAVCSELKQLLSHSLTDMIYPDADVNEEKIILLYKAHNKYKLTNEVYMFADNLNLTDIFSDAKKAVGLHETLKNNRRATGNMMVTKKMNCNYINNNLDVIGLLDKYIASRFINIINRIESRNHIADGINNSYQHTFNHSNLSNIILHNYYSYCQHYPDYNPGYNSSLWFLKVQDKGKR